MRSAYLYAIVYFGVMALLLLLSGIWIFAEKIGFSSEAVVRYYAGSASLALPGKSLYGQLEIVVPHLGAMGLFIMVLMHFMVFAPSNRRKPFVLIGTVTFLSAIAEILSGVLVSMNMHMFAMVKLAGFALFSFMTFIAVVMLLYESLRTLHHQHYV